MQSSIKDGIAVLRIKIQLAFLSLILISPLIFSSGLMNDEDRVRLRQTDHSTNISVQYEPREYLINPGRYSYFGLVWNFLD